MRFSVVLPALSAATLGWAQNLIIDVGGAVSDSGGVYQFIPPTLNNVANGDTITFRFTGAPGNHSVTQSSFQSPCEPIPGGFDSGWVFIPQNNVSAPPEWHLTITNATSPIWFFCKQLVPLTHCSTGMVGAINPPSSGNNFSAFQSNAENFQGPSGQGEGSLVGLVASASAGPGPSVSGALFFTGAPLATSTSPSSSNSGSTSGNGSTSAGGSGGNSGGSLTMTANMFVVALGIILGSSLCMA